MKRFISFLFSIHFVLYLTILPAEQEKATWTVFVIAQTKECKGPDNNPDYNLHRFFIQNLNDMANIGSNERLNILVHWEHHEVRIKKESQTPHLKEGIHRWKIIKGTSQYLQDLPFVNYPEKIVDFVRWGITNYPSKHIAIIFSGHGCGIIDPAPYEIQDFIPKKGILINMEDKTYLNNQMLIEAMQQINKILGKKIDLIGMDSCLMGGIEILYQLKDCAQIFVGSEEVENALGWRYSEIFGELASHSLNPTELAKLIVHSYGLFYQKQLNWFTLSAINLKEISNLKNNLDQIIIYLQECQKIYGNVIIIRNTITKARGNSIKFENEKRKKQSSQYIDLASFYFELHKNLQNLPTSESIEKLKKCLIDGIKLIETIVIANTTGKNFIQAKGISIYYPIYGSFTHFSYFSTKFAQESSWLQFLKYLVRPIPIIS